MNDQQQFLKVVAKWEAMDSSTEILSLVVDNNRCWQKREIQTECYHAAAPIPSRQLLLGATAVKGDALGAVRAMCAN